MEAFGEVGAIAEAGPLIGERIHPVLSAPDLCGRGEDTLGHPRKVIELMVDSLCKPVREHFGWAIGGYRAADHLHLIHDCRTSTLLWSGPPFWRYGGPASLATNSV